MPDKILAIWYVQLTKKHPLKHRSRPNILREAFIRRLQAFGFKGRSYRSAKKFYQALRRKSA